MGLIPISRAYNATKRQKKRRLRVFLMQPVDLPSENQEEAVGRLPLTKEVAACGYECIWDLWTPGVCWRLKMFKIVRSGCPRFSHLTSLKSSLGWREICSVTDDAFRSLSCLTYGDFLIPQHLPCDKRGTSSTTSNFACLISSFGTKTRTGSRKTSNGRSKDTCLQDFLLKCWLPSYPMPGT